MLACEPYAPFADFLRILCAHLREIGDMDEGIIERSEDAGDTEDEFTCDVRSVHLFHHCCWHPTYLHGPGGRERRSRSLHAQPSSWEAS
jgi:hypothetical protein